MEPNILVVLAGSATAVFTALLTAVGKARGQRTDEAVRMLSEMREWTEDLRESEEACRAELVKVREEVEYLRHEIDELRDQLRKG